MFSEMVANLAKGSLPESSALRQRFDIAVTKKLGVVRLPASFWMDDPKINPRSDHLFWAALLTQDRQRIDLALAVLAAELNETNQAAGGELQKEMTATARGLVVRLFELIGNGEVRRETGKKLERIIPELIDSPGNKFDD